MRPSLGGKIAFIQSTRSVPCAARLTVTLETSTPQLKPCSTIRVLKSLLRGALTGLACKTKLLLLLTLKIFECSPMERLNSSRYAYGPWHSIPPKYCSSAIDSICKTNAIPATGGFFAASSIVMLQPDDRRSRRMGVSQIIHQDTCFSAWLENKSYYG